MVKVYKIRNMSHEHPSIWRQGSATTDTEADIMMRH